MEEALARIEAMLAEERPHLVVTADAAGIVIAQDDPEYREICAAADLVTPDSYGVVWALRRAGHTDVERVSGVDLARRLVESSAERGYRLFFLGAAPGVAERAAERMRLEVPGCNIVGTHHGFFPADSDELVAAEIATTRPDVLLVGMGIPRQEKFLARALALTGARVGIGVGGTFDVFSGRAKRAPRWVRRLRLEWLWRTLLNPRKLSKVKALPRFVSLVLRSR